MHKIILTALFITILSCKAGYASMQGAPLDVSSEIASEYMSGEYASRNNDIKSAADMYAKALEKSPDNAILLQNAYKYALLAGNYPDAAKYASRYLEYSPESLNALLLLAIDEAARGDFTKASELLAKIPENTDKKLFAIDQLILPFVKVWVVAGKGEYGAALNMLAEYASSREISTTFIELQKALLYSISGNNEDAKASFDRLAAEEGIMPYHLVKSLAGFYESTGEWEKAAGVYEKFRRQHKAIPQLEKAAEMARAHKTAGLYVNTPKDALAEVMKEVSRLLYNSGLYREGLAYVRLATLLKPEDDESLILLTAYYEENAQEAEAIEVYKKISKASDFYTTSRISLATNLYRGGSKEEARQILLDLAGSVQDKYIPLVTLADLERRDNNHKQAAELYTKVLGEINNKDKSSWAIFFARGICYERTHNWQNAEQDFLAALELHPNQPDVLNYLAYSWIDRNVNLEEAKNMLIKAVQQRPDDPQIMDSVAWALYKMKEYDNASAFMEKAVEFLPQDAVINDHLGDIYWMQGRKHEARYQWQRALKYGPAESSSNQVLEDKIKNGLIAL